MNFHKTIKVIIISVLIFTLSVFNAVSQFSSTNELEKLARESFSNRDYQKALDKYETLKDLFPQQPEYQYYIGRCLLNLAGVNDDAVENLKFASIRGDIDDAWYYLGNAYYSNNELKNAIDAYRKFIAIAKKSSVKKLGVKEILSRTENELATESRSGKSNIKSNVQNTVTNVSLPAENKQEERESSIKDIFSGEDNSKSVETGLVKQEDRIGYVEKESEILNEKDVSIKNSEQLSLALNYQLAADSLNRKAKNLRADLKNVNDELLRKDLIAEISILEKESKLKQKEADIYFFALEDTVEFPAQPESTGSSHIEFKEEINGIKVYQYTDEFLQDFTKDVLEETPIIETEADVDFNEPLIQETMEENIEFRIYESPVYSSDNPIPERTAFTNKLVYCIQLGVFSKQLDNITFGGLSPVFYDRIEAKEAYKYYSGMFTTYNAANEALQKVKEYGFKDSFIVAFQENNQISVEKARELEYQQIKF